MKTEKAPQSKIQQENPRRIKGDSPNSIVLKKEEMVMEAKTQADLEKGEILVNPRSEIGDFAFFAQSSHHSIFVDEPQDVGGTDTGFSSFDLLATSLAACTSITLRYYAKHKGIPLGDFQVKISQESFIDPQSGEKAFHMIRHLYFPGVEDIELLEKFKEIAEKCPIHRTLQGKIVIDTEIVD